MTRPGPENLEKQPKKISLSSAQAAWDRVVQDYIEYAFARDPGFASSQGLHAFDGLVPDLSLSGIETTIGGIRALRERARGFSPEGLDDARRFEREALLAQADGELFWAERVEEHKRNPLYYSGTVDPSRYIARDYAPLEVRLKASIAHVQKVPEVLRAMRANLVTPLSRTHLEVSRDVYAGLITYLEQDFALAFAEADAQPRADLAEASASAIVALREVLAFFEQEQVRATDSFALGPTLFTEMLWATERVDTPLSRLLELGQSDLERNLDALKEACAAFAPKQDLASCAARVNDDKPTLGPLEAARSQLVALKAFVVAKGLVSIPADEDAKVEVAPPHQRWNQAFIDIPGPYDLGQPSIYYIAPPDPTWTKEEQNAYIPGVADLLFISAHEVWPGHFLQFLHANRVERLFGRLFVGYAFAEGWAHYTEELIWEEGFSTEPKLRVGQLLNALLRNVRYLSAIGLHTQGMTVEASEQMFRDVALQDVGNAKQQAARGTFDPGYLNYTLGKLIIRKLRADWIASRGGREAYRSFHDSLLSFGGPPLPLVRGAMLGKSSPAL